MCIKHNKDMVNFHSTCDQFITCVWPENIEKSKAVKHIFIVSQLIANNFHHTSNLIKNYCCHIHSSYTKNA